ncbi:MAG TPA: hypothetical protein DCM05_17195 [Elusimicrobia bacterium]|nr:hypothetical protein [Elusimicrobiota bacterium]
MIRSDWFKRQLDVLVAALAAAIGLKQKGDVPGALAALDASIRQAFGMSGQLALGLPLEDFLNFATRGVAPTPELLDALSGLFKEWASLLQAQGRAPEAELALARSQELSERAKPS